MSETDKLNARITKLERGSRQLALICVTVLLLPFLLASGGRQENDNGVVRARRFELVDEDGNLRAVLMPTDAGTKLAMYDADENLRLKLEADSEPGFFLYDEGNVVRAGIGAYKGGPQVFLKDKDKNFRANMGIWGDIPELRLRDGAGKLRVALRASPVSPEFEIRDAAGNKRAALRSHSTGTEFELVNREGSKRASFGEWRDGAHLMLWSERNELFEFPAIRKTSK